MTLKEKVKKVEPKCVNDAFAGGVYKCPVDYSYLNSTCELHGEKCTRLCTECWNQPFIENPDVGAADE